MDEQKRFSVSSIKQNDFVDVTVTHIVSPLEFYVAKTSELTKYAKMGSKLQAAYSCKTKASEQIYVPRQEMICAVNFDGTWYRGRLNGKTSSAREFNVWLVDVGTIKTVPWECIRQIDESFQHLPEAVACCYLAHVTPNNDLWTPDALVVFKRSIKHANRIQADIVDSKPGYHGVVLYEMALYQPPICINQMLVEKEFAVGDGLLTSRPKVETETLSDDSDSKTGRTTSSSQTKGSGSIDSKDRVQIVHIVSPGEFYITLAKNKSAVDQMHHHLQKHMQAVKADKLQKHKWKIGDMCLVKAKLLDESLVVCWYRGRVLTLDCIDNTCSVFLCDRGIVLDVKLCEITPTPEKFKSILDGAMRCHMAGVQPTNGLTQWSATSIDAFRKVVEDFEGI